MIVYLNGDYLPKENARISVDDRGFLFADGTYEVVRIYNGRLFRFPDHLNRLERSLREIRINSNDLPDLLGIAEKLIQNNSLSEADANLYIQITRGAAPRNHRFPARGTPSTVYVTAYPAEPPLEQWEQGVRVILVPDIRWNRCDIKSISLLPNVLASQSAKDAEAHEAIFVRNGTITEGTHTNFAAVFGNRLWTHPADNHILDGITRDVTLEICPRIDVDVIEEAIPEKKLQEADECLLLGSTTEIMPVVQINSSPVGNGLPGPVTRKLQQTFQKITREK